MTKDEILQALAPISMKLEVLLNLHSAHPEGDYTTTIQELVNDVNEILEANK